MWLRIGTCGGRYGFHKMWGFIAWGPVTFSGRTPLNGVPVSEGIMQRNTTWTVTVQVDNSIANSHYCHHRLSHLPIFPVQFQRSKHFFYFQKHIFSSFNAFQRLHEHGSTIYGTNKLNQPRSLWRHTFHPLWAHNIKWLCCLSCSNKSVASSCVRPVQLRGERLIFLNFFSYLDTHLQLRFKNSESFFSSYFCHNTFSTNSRFTMTASFVNCVLLTDQRRFQLADFVFSYSL